MRKRKMKDVAFITLLLIMSLYVMPANSTAIFESSTGNSDTYGIAVSDEIWVFHSFEITQTVQLESIGGTFWSLDGSEREIFGGIIELSSPWDKPDSFDLSTSDVLGTTLVSVGSTIGDYEGDIDLVLEAGWYSLVFGAGAFGADSSPDVTLMMPHLDIDLSDLYAYSALTTSDPFRYVAQASQSRFYVKASEVPLPSVLSLFLLGLGSLVVNKRRTVVNWYAQ